MIGYREIIDWSDLENESDKIDYRNLKDIQLSYFTQDQHEENWD